jgi:hypothetical protein
MDQQPEAHKRKGMKPKPLVIRLLSHIKRNGSGCFEWTGSKNNMGYGTINVNRMPALAHRISYLLFVGDIKSDMVVDHLCRNRSCINPSHLEQVTQGENMRRGVSVCAENARKKFCKRGHEFSTENIYALKNGGRECRKCNSIRKSRKKEMVVA